MSSLSGTTQAFSGGDNTQCNLSDVKEDRTTTALSRSEGFEDLYTELTLSLGTVRLNLHFVQRNGTIAEKVPALRQAFDSLVTAGGLLQKLHLSQNTINDDKRVSRAYKSHVEKLVEDFDSTFEAYSDESRVLSPVLEAMLNLESHPLAFMVQAGDDGHEDTATSGQSEHLAST
ncbi:hypothetical protein EHS25_008852 [Saitozyma podzolica]|uniref:Uncharacterized protein n=1 Tax=Saitozyma podzolica TaxID=1890683 RepID=A0A427YMZ9_9TREE|nr:hypothetical protein EHS25_008852 [Saitozyma podzolica]